MPNTIELYANNARTTLAGSLTNVATSIVLQSGAGALFPNPNNAIGEFAKATLQDAATGLRNEIVYITARTGDILTVVRGQDGSTAQVWNAGDTVFEGVTAATLASFVQPAKLQSGQYTYATSGGSTTAYTATFSPAIAVLTDGMQLIFDTTTVGTNTTTTPTFSPNGLPARTIVKLDGLALAIGDMPSRAVLSYDLANTRWLLMNSVSAELVGQVVMVATATAPTNFLKCNGAAISRTTYAQLFQTLVTSQGFNSQTFTVNIASPAIFTKANHGFVGGERLRLSTTGALPTGLNTTTDYFVETIDVNTFYLSSLVSGGLRTNTSGSQSGTHSFTQSLYGLGDGSTTFNLPDFRGLFLRGMDDGAGIDAAHYLGSKQRGTILPADTNLGTSSAVWTMSTNQANSIAVARNGHSVDPVTDNNQYSSIGIYSAVAGQASPASLSIAIATDGTLATGVARPVNASVNYCIRYK